MIILADLIASALAAARPITIAAGGPGDQYDSARTLAPPRPPTVRYAVERKPEHRYRAPHAHLLVFPLARFSDRTSCVISHTLQLVQAGMGVAP